MSDNRIFVHESRQHLDYTTVNSNATGPSHLRAQANVTDVPTMSCTGIWHVSIDSSKGHHKG
jgi:hypothetical protein